MALRTIVQDGDPILKKVCRPVTKFDDRLGTLLDDMKETLIAANGLGLAGPQVGMMRRLFICLDDRDLPEEVPANYEYKFIEFINPEILELSDEQVELYEGCLSFPGAPGDSYPGAEWPGTAYIPALRVRPGFPCRCAPHAPACGHDDSRE